MLIYKTDNMKILWMLSAVVCITTAVIIGNRQIEEDLKPIYQKNLGKPLILTEFIKTGQLKQGSYTNILIKYIDY